MLSGVVSHLGDEQKRTHDVIRGSLLGVITSWKQPWSLEEIRIKQSNSCRSCIQPTQCTCTQGFSCVLWAQLCCLQLQRRPGLFGWEECKQKKAFLSAVSPSLSRGYSFPAHSPSSRLVQRVSSCRSLSKALLDIFYVQDVGFLRTTLIIYLFHFSCVIVPIFYTKVLSLLWNSCCFIVALLPLKLFLKCSFPPFLS